MNNALYKKFKDFVGETVLSIAGIGMLTFNEVALMVETRKFPLVVMETMKLKLINEMQEDRDESDKQQIQGRLEALRASFPDFEVERGREGEKPFITIWLKGKPDVVDPAVPVVP